MASARAIAVTTMRTQMQSSLLKKLSYPSSHLAFSESNQNFHTKARFELQLLLLVSKHMFLLNQTAGGYFQKEVIQQLYFLGLSYI